MLADLEPFERGKKKKEGKRGGSRLKGGEKRVG